MPQFTVIFDAREGSQGLMNYSGDVYAHTGVITTESQSGSDWKYVKTAWGQNTPDTKLIRTGQNKYQLEIGPDIQTYYGVPNGEEILQMAFVFRSGETVNGGYLEGKTENFGDIFIDVSDSGGGLQVNFQSPGRPNQVLELNDLLIIELFTSIPTDIELFEDDVKIGEGLQATAFQYQHLVQDTNDRVFTVRIDDGSTAIEEQFSYVVNRAPQVASVPFGTKLGWSQLDANQARLLLEAPGKSSVLAVGDFSDWLYTDEFFFQRSPDQRYFWKDIDISNCPEDIRYQFVIDGEIVVADPLSEVILSPWDDGAIPSSTFPDLPEYPERGSGNVSWAKKDGFTYNWQSNDYDKPSKDRLVIYELLIRDFLESRSYLDLIDTISYLKKLGVNAIELMPVHEFEGNDSWGYNTSFQGAVDKYYGRPEHLKEFVDVCHENGIVVILDVVFNHVFSQSPLAQMYWDATNFRPSADNPWLNVEAKHPFNVGYDVNHEYEGTQEWMDQVLEKWIQDYQIDGFRFDLSKGFTQRDSDGNVNAWGQYDGTRIQLLKRLADVVWNIDPSTYIILEHFAENTEEIELTDYGMLVWSNLNHNYTEASMGYTTSGSSNLGWAYYNYRNLSRPHNIAYMESHDEERMMYKNLEFGNSSGGYDTRDFATAIDRVKLASAFFFTIPGPKMIWQFGELGFPFSINTCTDGSVDPGCRLAPKPVRWDYLQDVHRKSLFDFMRDLIFLKNEYGAFNDGGSFSFDLFGSTKWIVAQSSDLNAVIVGNFDVNNQTVSVNFPFSGTWYDYITGGNLGLSNVNQSFDLVPGEFHIYLDRTVDRPSQNEPTSVLNPGIISSNEVRIYPNPINNQPVFLESDIEWYVNKSMPVYDALGKEVGMTELEVVSDDLYSLQLPESLTPGCYLIRLSAEEGTMPIKLVFR